MADSLDIYIVQLAGEIQRQEVFTLFIEFFCGWDDNVTVASFELYPNWKLSHLGWSCYCHRLSILLKVLLITNVEDRKMRTHDSVCERIWRILSFGTFRTTVKLSQRHEQLTVFYRLEQVLWIFSVPNFSLCCSLYWKSARTIATPVRLVSDGPPFIWEVVGNE